MNEALHARERATIAQQTASDPRISSWVGASAGSGKTKVLTDRVLRLLLREDAAPGRILCLTFTKAAAAEMQTRLARRLGAWSALDDDALRAEVGKVIGEPATRAEIDTARRLFCRVLEQPGGMRILTIHSFCQSLLQSFPLEAQLSPGFAMLEEADSDALLAEAREAALAGGAISPDALGALSRLVSADALGSAIRVLHRHRNRVEPILAGSPDAAAMLHGCLGLPDGEREEDVAAAFCAPPEEVLAAARLLAEHKTRTSRELGARMLALLSLPPAERSADEWWGCLHTKEGTPRTALVKADDCFARECDRLAELEARRTAHRLRAATGALLAAARPVLRDYADRKGRRGALDFDDLIARAQALLLDPGSAWVLFKLDGGLDHILLDEAQDTNPAQWGIAEAIAAEFFAGRGTREEGARTFFAVGDAKQSIFGFQGADARGFLTRQDAFGTMIRAGGGFFDPVDLNVSFRSCTPILALVDRVFEDGSARGGVVQDGDRLEHSTDRAGHAGLVEIWPPLERPAKDEATPWVVPETPVTAGDAEAQLADALAARIRHMLDHERLPARGDRPVGPGDVMVLVRRRTSFVELLVGALKGRGVPVGGVDRLRLVDAIAVADVMALLDALLLPEDDLALAAALKSPLIGLSEEELFALCHGRDGRLWHALRERRDDDGAVGAAARTVAALMDRADYVTPHALMSEILGEGGGRARLLARLGMEAAEALDELLSAAIRYEARNPPSLQGFLHWLRAGGATVKREAEGAGDAVRVMTAHGSKGLQAPVVIIPDIGRGGARDTLMWGAADAAGSTPTIPLWAPRKEFQARAWRDARAAAEAASNEEENRLLYVALTRAEDRLIVCGIAPAKASPHPPWHQQVKEGFFRGHDRGEAGFAQVAFDPAAFGYAGSGRFGEEGWQVSAPQSVAPRPEAVAIRAEGEGLPRWATERAPAEASEDPVAPSRTEGEEGPAAAPHGAADPGGRRFRRGLLIHALLQFLPDHPAAAREGIARRHLARPGHGLSAAEVEATWEEVRGVLEHPALGDAFAPGSLAEAPLAGTVGGRAVAGQVDRLSLGPDRVVVVDYKTNRPPPARPEDVSPAYLRQMAAYRAVLRAGWPGRQVDCALVWTWSGHVMPLPDALLDPHAPG